jgi:hypothetical protein
MPDVDVALHKSKFPGLSAVTLYAADNFGERNGSRRTRHAAWPTSS